MAVKTAHRQICALMRQSEAALPRLTLMSSVFVVLGGCAMGGFSLEKAVPDKTTITSSIKASQKAEPDQGSISDQSAIKSIVSALNFSEWGKQPVPWANPDTGSQGTITSIAETRSDNLLCRQFQTSREAFDGVSIYRGETCMHPGGNWTLTSFAPI